MGAFALVLAFLGLAFAGPASAQLPSGCDEYDEDICIDDEPGHGDEDGGTGFGGHDGFGPGGHDGDGADRGTGSGDADGTLPFTGYPLTGLIVLLLILLAVGLAVRSGTALRDKLAHRH